MPQFFDPKARVVFSSTIHPNGCVHITPPIWELQDNNGIPMAMLPLRRCYNISQALPGEGIVHVSTVTGERHIHGELQDVSKEVGMERVYAENVRPQRPLDANQYDEFSAELALASFGFFQRQSLRILMEAKQSPVDNCMNPVCEMILS